jgi:dolichyl-phosphate beta-glucosyltransferase
MKRLAKFVLPLVVTAIIVRAMWQFFDVPQTLELVRGAHRDVWLLGVLCMGLAYLLRGARWRMWERELTYWDSLGLVLIGFMGNNVLPARLGEVLRAHCAAAKFGGDRGRTAALASIAAERILDGTVLSLFGLACVALVSVDRRLEWSLFAASFVFAGLGLAFVFGVRNHERLRQFVAAGHRKFPGHITAFAGEKVNQFLDGLLPLGTPGRMLSAIAITTAIWAIEVAFCYFVGAAVWDDMTIGVALLLLVVVNFASLVPLTMGGIGTIEAVAPFFLISAGVAPSAALAIVLIQHASQYILTTLAGGAIYLARGFYRIPIARPKRSNAAPAQPPSTDHQGEHSRILADTRTSLGELGASLKPASREEIQLSIVIPAYNEQLRLPRTVLETIRWCTKRGISFEVVIADDGSRDGTLALAQLFEESDARIRALACPHMGKGATVRFGVLNARGQVIMFMDADGATPLGEIPKLLDGISKGYDVVIGSRVVQHSGDAVVKARPHRRVIGRAFALFVNIFAIEGIADTQCGFKMFRREAAEAIFSRQKLAGFSFDVEVLFIANKLGFRIAEVPVNWVEQPGSKVNLVTDSTRMLWDLTHIRWLHRDLPAGNVEREARSAV